MGKMKRLLALFLMLAVMAGSVPALSEELPAAEPAIEEVVIEETPAPAEEVVIEETVSEISEEPEISEESIAPEVTEGPELVEEVVPEPPVEPSVEPVLLAEVEPLNPPMIVFGEDWFHGDDGAVVIPCEAGDAAFEIEWTFDGNAELYRIQTAMVPERGEDEVRRDVCSVTERSVELPTAAYLDGTYMLYLTAVLPDGMVVSNQLRFRLQLPQKIALNAEEITLGVGESFTLEALTNYGGAAECSFESSKPKYAAVSADGVVTAKKAGKAVITASFGELTAECRVTILRAPSSVTVSQKKLTLSAGQSAQLAAEVNKNSAGAISWSSNSEIASVDENGFVTAHVTGTAKITATSYNGKKAVCTLTIVPAPSFVELDKAEISLPMGMSAQLKARSDAGSNPGFTYHSSDENIATVDAEGKITAVSTGVAKIIVSTYNGFTAECAVSVTPAPTMVTLNAEEVVLGVGEKFQIEAAVDQGDEAGYTYASKNARTATVDKTGLIVAKKAGTTVIRVTAFNGVYADCAVTVKKAPSSVKFADSKIELSVGQTAELEVVLSSGSAGEYSLSSDSECVRVNADGSITALSSGTAKIMVRTYNGKKATCTVNIVGLPTYLNLEVSEFTLPMGMTGQIVPQIDPGSAASFGYVSSDESIAAVDESGKISAVSTGTAIITVSTHNGLTAECAVNVTPAPTAVTLNAEALELGVGEKYQIIASADQGDDAGFTYASKTARVATVNESGVITAKKAGTTVIRVTAFNGVYADCEVTVKRAPSSIKLAEKQITLTVGQVAQIGAVLSSGSAGGISWSSDSECASVDASGRVTAVSEGAAKITATTFNGKKASCTVNILSPEYSVTALRREGSSIIAAVSTIKACELYVEVLNEEGSKLLFSGTAAADGELQMAELAVAMDGKFPDYFILRAQLQDVKGNPLSSAYTTKRYTREYQQFESQSPADFPAEKVLDFGEAGYGVLSDSVIAISGEVNQSGGKYTFTPPRALKAGDALLIEGEPVKIKTIESNPDGSVTITRDEQVYLADFYQVLKLDATIDVGQAQQQGRNAAMLADFDYDDDLHLFTLEADYKGKYLTAHADFYVGLHVRAIYDVKLFGKDYFEFETSINGAGSANATLTGSYEDSFEMKLYSGKLPIGSTGLIAELDLTVPLEISASATGHAEAAFTFDLGFKYDPRSGFVPIKSKTAGAEAYIEGKFSIKTGPELTMRVPVLDLIEGSVTGWVGTIISGELENMNTNANQPDENGVLHACKGCVDIDVEGFAYVNATLSYDISEDLNGDLFNQDVLDTSWHVGDAFLSILNEAISVHGGKIVFGWGVCPNNKYRTTINAADEDGKLISGVSASISGGKLTSDVTGSTSFEAYLYPGSYSATGSFNGERSSESFVIRDAAKTVTIESPSFDISGTVTSDKTGKPIKGAQVSLTAQDGKTYSASTDASGNYSMTQLRTGVYDVSFTAANYRSRTVKSMSFASGTVHQFNAALVPLDNFPYITASTRNGTVQALPESGSAENIPEVFLTASTNKWGEVTEARLRVEGCAEEYVYSPGVGIYSVSITGFDMGNHAYTFILDALCSGTMGGTEAYILQVQGGRIVKVKEFTHSERTDKIYVEAKFTSNSKYSGVIYPSKVKFSGYKMDGQDRKGKALWENGTGYLDPELREDGYYNIIFTTSERCLYNADAIGNSKTRYVMKNGSIAIDEQWYEGEQLPLLSAKLNRDGRDKTLSPVSGSASNAPKITASFGYTDYRAASVTITHPDCKKAYTYKQNEYSFSSVDVYAVPSENGYTIVINGWGYGTGMDADVIVLQAIDGVLKEIWHCNSSGITDKISVSGSFSSQMNFSGSISPSNVKFSGVMLEENRYDWIKRKGLKLYSHGTHMGYEENSDGTYSLVFSFLMDSGYNWDDIGSCNTRYSIGNGKLKMEKQWLESSVATVKNS